MVADVAPGGGVARREALLVGAAARWREALLGSCAGCGAAEASDGWVRRGVGLAVVAAGGGAGAGVERAGSRRSRCGGGGKGDLAREREGGIGRRGIQLDTIAMAHHPLVRH